MGKLHAIAIANGLTSDDKAELLAILTEQLLAESLGDINAFLAELADDLGDGSNL